MTSRELTDSEKRSIVELFSASRIKSVNAQRLAQRVAQSISDSGEREKALISVCQYLAGAGNIVDADLMLREISSYFGRAYGLSAIGNALAETTPEEAAAYLRGAEENLCEIEDPDDQSIILDRIARGYISMKSWHPAKQAVEKIPVPLERLLAICQLAQAFDAADQIDNANEMAEQAKLELEQLAASERAVGGDAVARLYAKLGNVSEAKSLFDEATAFSKYDQEPSKMLQLISNNLAKLGHFDWAREVAKSIENQARQHDALSFVESCERGQSDLGGQG